jgi:predicted DNA-binding transcriptional regulator YafY
MRASRLVSILLILQARGRVTASALAGELEVSVRTVYRDLADLGAAGVPVYGERGEGGGYQLLDGYRTNLTGLTSDEASALLLTGASGAVAELGLGTLLATTRLKLLAAVPPGLRDVATRAEQRFHVDPGIWAHQPPRDQHRVQTVAHAIWHDRQVRMTYARGGGHTSQRTLHPLGLVHKTGSWYLVATDHPDHVPRVYRADRIRAVHELDSDVQRPDDFDLAAFWAAWETDYASSLPTFTAEVRLGPRALRYRDAIGPLAPRVATERDADADGWVRQTLLFDGLHAAAAALLALAPDVEVLEPAELRDYLAETAQQILDRNRIPLGSPT